MVVGRGWGIRAAEVGGGSIDVMGGRGRPVCASIPRLRRGGDGTQAQHNHGTIWVHPPLLSPYCPPRCRRPGRACRPRHVRRGRQQWPPPPPHPRAYVRVHRSYRGPCGAPARGLAAAPAAGGGGRRPPPPPRRGGGSTAGGAFWMGARCSCPHRGCCAVLLLAAAAGFDVSIKRRKWRSALRAAEGRAVVSPSGRAGGRVQSRAARISVGIKGS